MFRGCFEVIANLLTALRGWRSSRHYVGRHRLPEAPTLTEDDTNPQGIEVSVAMMDNDGSQTMVLPQLAPEPAERRA